MNKFVKAGSVREINGSILAPHGSGLRMILSVCSQNGEYSSRLFNLLKNRWKVVAQDYREWFVLRSQFMKLGAVNQSFVGSEIVVMQAVCFDQVGKLDEVALKECIKKLVAAAKYEKATIHISKMLLQDIPSLEGLLTDIVLPESLNLCYYDEPTKVSRV